ncbi:MAG TPA: C25 family cysteine peptidase, partial [Candidatus Cloacimonadota bacterium]|nr:C25 family cysteine peptidase [Candidatus Cloacimonadota bacterium]
STQELTVYTNIQLRVNFTSAPGLNELPAPVQTVSASFDKLYSSLILNYGDYRDLVLANTPPRYLIIHGNNTDANFLAAIDNYALWKRQKGADVDVASTTTAQAGSSTSSIQTYIRNRYNNPATRPDFVILIGDTTGSYTIPAFLNNSGGSDYPYTFMNTGDILGDIFVGRISAENLSQLLVMQNKIYVYERDVNVDMAAWQNRMLLVGDWDPSGISTMYISKYIKELALDVNPDYTFTELYSAAPAPSAMNVAINQGIGFFSFRGYIGMSGWAPPSESSFFNGQMLPHAVIITCSTNNYWNGTGHAELFTRFGTTAAPKGAVTAIGMSTSSTHTTFNNVLHGAIFDGIFTHGMRTMGESMLHGKLYMNSIFGVSSPANVEKFTHWCNLMGDPTMEVFTGIPSTFNIVTDTFIPLGLSLLDVAVSDELGLPVEGASVVLSLGSTILSRGYTDTEGNVILVMPSGMVAGNATLTISRHNFKPLQTPIDIVEIATLVPDAIIIDDDNLGASSGNNNGLVGAGETVEIYFGLKNTGIDTISGITGTVATTNPFATILQGNINYPQILGNTTANNLSPIVIQIDPK